MLVMLNLKLFQQFYNGKIGILKCFLSRKKKLAQSDSELRFFAGPFILGHFHLFSTRQRKQTNVHFLLKVFSIYNLVNAS